MKTLKIIGIAAITGALAAGGATAPAAAPGDPAPWKVGVAKADITPVGSIRMAGFGFRTHPSEGVRMPIYTRALALQDSSGAVAVIATLDISGISREMAEVIAERCRSQFGLERDRLIINVSHTHSGPSTRMAGDKGGPQGLPPPAPAPTGAPAAGQPPAGPGGPGAPQREEMEAITKYTGPMVDKVVATIGEAMHHLQPAALEFGQSLAGIAVNRRRSTVFAGVPGGPVDHDVPVVTAKTPDGRLIAIVVGYACHSSAMRDYLISNDWPGYALQEIDKAHPGATALFIQGCGGDSVAYPRLGEELARKHGEMLAAAVEDVLRAKMTPLAGPLAATFDHIDLPYRTAPTREDLQAELKSDNELARRHGQRVLGILDRGGKLPTSYSYPVQVWEFGRSLRFIALGGEPVADIGLRLKRQYGFDTTWVAGYSNDVMSYIPSLRVLKEGGYEAGDPGMGSGQLIPWSAGMEETLFEGISDIVKRTDKKIP